MRLNARLLGSGVLVLSAFACASESSTPAGPEIGTVENQTPGLPRAWFGGSVRSDVYEVGIDNGVRRSGSASAYLRSRTNAVDASSFASIGQSMSAVTYRGRRVRLSGYVRVDSVTGGGAGLWMRVDGATATLGFDNMISYGRPITGTTGWRPYDVVLDVPADAVGVTIGALFEGRGLVRIDDVKFEIVDTTVPTSRGPIRAPTTADSATVTNTYLRNSATPSNLDFEGHAATTIADAATVAWLGANARPFVTDAPTSGFDDLAEIGTIVGTARVVALGEATHGTREFFRMKHRTFEYLVETQGFTHFTIEATMPESRAMDRYVTRGEGDPEKLLSNLYFWTWNTEEVLDLVKWMRAYNVRASAPKLRFVGFDMQSPQQAVDSILSTLTRLDATLGQRARTTVSCLAPARDASGLYASSRYLSGTTAIQRVSCADSLSALATTVTTRRAQWAATNSAEELDWIEQYVTLVRQWARMAASSSGSAERGKAMADNLLWVADKNPAARIFAWAHNYHVSRKPGAMGSFVGARLGTQYRVFGFTFGLGRLNAVGMNASGAFSGVVQHTVDAIDVSSLEAVFAATNQPRLIFDARRIASGGSAAATLDKALRMRTIGAVYAAASASSYFDQTLIPLDYDALIWFANTTQSTLLPFR